MSDLTRRDLIKAIGVASATPWLAPSFTSRSPAAVAAPILPLTSTSEVYTPARGRASYDKFSFDFPEPSVEFAGFRFGFLVFTGENAYALDASRMNATIDGDTMTIDCSGLTWAGGQEKAKGKLTAHFRQSGNTVEWTATAEMERPIKTITAIIRGVPRGRVGFGAPGGGMPNDNEIWVGYPFSGGDLNAAGGMATPLAVVTAADNSCVAISSLDAHVCTKRFFFQPGDNGFRVEAIAEAPAWNEQTRWEAPPWRIMRTATAEEAVQAHYDHLDKVFHLPKWDTRADVPAWLRDIAMVTTLHGQHYSGFIFNNYAQQLEILKWIATQMPASRVLVFLPAWDGRYYWDYPDYRVNDRMGGDPGFRRLIDGAHTLGFRMMPMFGTNTANRNRPSFKGLSDAVTSKVDGNVVNLDWVDWDSDRHNEGWLAYMNLGAASWRNWLTGRIDDMITRYGVDAYFLDIVGGHINSRNGDMHDGTRRMVMDLRARHPQVVCVGEMHYDALLEFIPMFQVGGGARMAQYARVFSHLSSPAPGRGSSGVHESGFGHFNPETLGLSPNAIPTLQVVDDTFTQHRDVMAAIIAKARERAGI